MKKGLWILLIIIIAAAGVAGYWYYSNNNAASAAAEEEDALQTATVRQGDITISATGAGTIVPADEIALSFPTSGILTELFVRVGDDVEAGAVLARIDDTAVQEALANAQLQLQQSAMQTDAATTETGISFDDINVAQALLNLEIVQGDLQDLHNWQPDADDIAQAEANLQGAQASHNAALGSEAASSTNITVNNINLEQAQRDLATAQSAWDTAYDPGREWEFGVQRMATALEAERDAADRNLQKAQDNLAIAQANYNSAVSSSNHSSSTNAQSNILSAQLALAAAQTGPVDDEIEAAETAVRQAELAYQQALLNQESNALSLTQAEMNVASAEAALDETVLTAPSAGTIMTVNASVGENAASTLLTLADLEQPLVEIYMDETDLDKIGMDYEVEVVFDALPDDTFIGHVVQVDPQLSQVSGVSAVRALVQLDADSFAKPQTLPIGLNATVEVIGGRATGALLVPVEAVRELSPGEYAVFVMEEGEPALHFVEVGLMDFTFAEILSGLKAGDVVTTGIIETE